MAAELWKVAGGEGPVEKQPWPQASDELLQETEVELPVMIDNRVRTRITVPVGLGADKLERHALESEAVESLLAGRDVKRVFAVADRAVNILLEPSDT